MNEKQMVLVIDGQVMANRYGYMECVRLMHQRRMAVQKVDGDKHIIYAYRHDDWFYIDDLHFTDEESFDEKAKIAAECGYILYVRHYV